MKDQRITSFGSKPGIKTSLPISPHIFLYKFPLPALTSIATRFTGLFLYLGGLLLAVDALYDIDFLVSCLTTLRSDYWYLVPFVKFSIAFPLAFHYFFGLRHLFWDWTGRGLSEVETVYFWSRILLATTLVVSVLFTLIRF